MRPKGRLKDWMGFNKVLRTEQGSRERALNLLPGHLPWFCPGCPQKAPFFSNYKHRSWSQSFVQGIHC